MKRPIMKRNWYGIGIVSSRTLRPQDVIPALIWAAQHLRLTKDERKKVSRIARAVSDVENGQYGEEDAYWTDEVALFDWDTLDMILDNHALPYFYFGAGADGADFGWWLSESIEDDFDGLKVSDMSEVPRGYTGEVLHVNDHGNLTLYSANRGRLHEVWTVV